MEASNHFRAGQERLQLVSGTLAMLACPALILLDQAQVTGTVTDRHNSPVAEASIVIESRDNLGSKAATQSDQQGAFALDLGQPGRYLLGVAHVDFFPIEDKPVELINGVNIVKNDVISPITDCGINKFVRDKMADNVGAIKKELVALRGSLSVMVYSTNSME